MIKQVLCSIWGHVWETCLTTSGHIRERCKRCQAWKGAGRG